MNRRVAVVVVLNFLLRALRKCFRVFVHSSAQVDALVRSHGFPKRVYRKRGLWQVVVYAKTVDVVDRLTASS
jgi:hypothetical protein